MDNGSLLVNACPHTPIVIPLHRSRIFCLQTIRSPHLQCPKARHPMLSKTSDLMETYWHTCLRYQNFLNSSRWIWGQMMWQTWQPRTLEFMAWRVSLDNFEWGIFTFLGIPLQRDPPFVPCRTLSQWEQPNEYWIACVQGSPQPDRTVTCQVESFNDRRRAPRNQNPCCPELTFLFSTS